MALRMDMLLITVYFKEKEKSACAFARVAALLVAGGSSSHAPAGRKI